MTLKERINQDLKTALLSGNKLETDTLRGLKSVILYAEVAQNSRETGLSEAEITNLLNKELKKRQESADLYRQGGAEPRAQKELDEKAIIEKYLPEPISDDQLSDLVDSAINDIGKTDPQAMGKIIARVKQETQGAADGAKVAQLTRERLSQ